MDIYVCTIIPNPINKPFVFWPGWRARIQSNVNRSVQIANRNRNNYKGWGLVITRVQALFKTCNSDVLSQSLPRVLHSYVTLTQRLQSNYPSHFKHVRAFCEVIYFQQSFFIPIFFNWLLWSYERNICLHLWVFIIYFVRYNIFLPLLKLLTLTLFRVSVKMRLIRS